MSLGESLEKLGTIGMRHTDELDGPQSQGRRWAGLERAVREEDQGRTPGASDFRNELRIKQQMEPREGQEKEENGVSGIK